MSNQTEISKSLPAARQLSGFQLYKLDAELASYLRFIDEELGGEIPPDFEIRLDGMAVKRLVFIEEMAKAIRNSVARAACFDIEIERLLHWRRIEGAFIERAKHWIKGSMEKNDETRHQFDTLRVRVQRNSHPGVLLTPGVDIMDLPIDLWKVDVQLDRQKVLEDVKAGGTPPEGVSIVTGTHLRIE